MKNLQESEALALLQLPKGECILCHDEVILVEARDARQG